MDIIKRKICIEDLITRENGDNYGALTATSIYVNVFLTQDIDDMGIFTDCEFSASTSSPVESDFYYTGDTTITGYSSSRLVELKTYNRSSPYDTNIINESSVYSDYNGNVINGISKVTSLSTPTGYTFNANNDQFIGTENQSTGILYNDYPNRTVMTYKAEGWNMTNISYSGLVKDEIMMGIIYPPEVLSDVFIDRGNTTVFEPHLRLSEVESIEHLELYHNGYYKMLT